MTMPDGPGETRGEAPDATHASPEPPRPGESREADGLPAEALALLAEHTRNGVVITDASGKVEWVNAAFTVLTGYTLDEVVGRTPGSVVQGPGTDPETIALMGRHVRAGEAFRVEVVNYHKSGDSYWVAIEVRPIRDGGGNLTHFVGVQTDVSPRKRAEARLRAHLEATQVLASSVSLDVAIPLLLKVIATALGLDGGEFWRNDGAGALRLAGSWWADDGLARRFGAASPDVTLAWGEGLPGQCWALGRAGEVVGLDGPFCPAGDGRGLAVESPCALAFPVSGGDEVLGVMTLQGRSTHGLDGAVRKMLTVLGRQIGLFIERRRTEETLRDAEARARTILESAVDGVVIIDEHGIVDALNPAGERIFGYAAGELVGRNVSVLMPEAYRAQHEDSLRRYLRTGEPHFVGRSRRVVALRKDGTTFPVELSLSEFRLHDRRMFTGIARDVTEWERAEAELLRSRDELEARVKERTAEIETAVAALQEEMADRGRAEILLRESERRFRFLADSMPQIVWTALPDGQLDYYNHRCFEFTGLPEEQANSETWLSIVHPDDLPRTVEFWSEAVRTGKPFDIEHRLLGNRTGYRWFLGRALPGLGDDGQVIKWVGTCTDIHDQKLAEDKLRRAHDELELRVNERTAELVQANTALQAEVVERQRAVHDSQERQRFVESLAEANPSMLYVYDLVGQRNVWANSRLTDVLGYEPAAIQEMGASFLPGLMHPDDVHLWQSDGARFAGVGDGQAIESEYRMRHADGSWRWLRSRELVFLRGDDGRPTQILGAAEDVTERRLAESALAERVRLALLGADIGVAVTRLGSLRETLQQCAEILVTRLNAAFARIWTLDSTGHFLELQASAGLYTHIDGGHARVPVTQQYKIGRIAQTRRPHLTNQVVGDPEISEPEWARREGMVAFAGHPLVVEDRLCGVIALFARSPLTDATLDALASIADGIALAIDHKRFEQALRESEQRFREVADGVPVILTLSNPTDGVTFMNRTGVEFFGCTEQELLGRACYELLHPDDVNPCRTELLRAYSQLLPVLFEYRMRRHDGVYRWMSNGLVPRFLPDGTFASYVGSMTDVTERRESEEALRRAKDAAEAATRAKGEFLANMSHEIRTPMNGILGMTELALETELTGRQREYLGLVKTSAESLLTVINDILDFSRIESGKLRIDPFPFRLRDVLEETALSLAVRAHDKGLELACRIAGEVPDAVVGDADRLRQVLVNLIGNAIKFTERGEVVVTAELEAAYGAEFDLHVTVRDTGIGIPPDKQEVVFAPFEQADGSTTRRFGGTGLGLAISANLVGLMGGRIWLDSAPGRGSTFHFTIRLAVCSVDAPPACALTSALVGQPVLIVDDNATNRRIFEEVLEAWGARPLAVDGGPAALEALRDAADRHEPFAAALVDGMMPGMDGEQLIGLIRAEPAIAGVPVLLLTSAGRPDDPARLQALGVAACLTKPVRQSELFNELTRALGPATDADRPTAPAAASPRAAAPHGLRVLLAEDNLVNQKVAVYMLERLGHSVTVAGDGREALQALYGAAVDLVLMDLQMPGMDGFEALAAIRASESTASRRLPVIALTAHAMKGDRERCLAAGFDGYITKPIREPDLRAELDARVPSRAASAPEPGPIAGSDDDPHVCCLLERCGNDAEFACALAETFLDATPATLGAISSAVADGDSSRLSFAAHSLRGACLTAGDDDLAAALARLEDAARRGDIDTARGYYKPVADGWARLSNSFAAMLRVRG
jgi:PAS domain S-box-containing protein